MRIAVTGLHPDLIGAAPWDDPTWEKWTLPWGPKRYVIKADVLFEIHDPEDFPRYASQTYEDEIRDWEENGARVIRQDDFPLQEAIAVGGDYFQCSMAYMLAGAALKIPEEIGVFACDPTGKWAYQKPNVEYWIGIARGMGLKVTIQDVSGLCRYDPGLLKEVGGPYYPTRYGWKA